MLDLDANGRTVIHLASFFEELKKEAHEVVQRAQASERGYFSTHEEESTSRILVSYWHSRNALFELITNLRRATDLDPVEQDRAFLIGFSAALLLVDAARFLREVAEARPVVKRKLNEAAPSLGVPPGVYDTVQKSLLSARHGWHLYHAVQYYQQHEASFRARKSDGDDAQLIAIIDRLRHQLDVPLRQFATAKLKTRGRRLGRGLQQALLGRAIYGLQKLAGTLVADKYLRLGHQPTMPPDIATLVQDLLQPGDVLVVRKEYALTNYFLPGYWPHAALFLGSTSALQELGIAESESYQLHQSRLAEMTDGGVMESMRDGVRLRPLSSPFGSDSIVVLRPQLAPTDRAAAVLRSLSHQGKPYDFSFDFSRSDRLVCTEVVFRAFDGLGQMHMPLIQRVGRPTLSGDDLIDMAVAGQSFDPVAVYAPTFATEIATGLETKRLIGLARGTTQPE